MLYDAHGYLNVLVVFCIPVKKVRLLVAGVRLNGNSVLLLI